MFSETDMFDLSPEIVSARKELLTRKKQTVPVGSLLKWMDPRIIPQKISDFLPGESNFILDLPVFEDREPYDVAKKYVEMGFRVFSVSTNPFWNNGYDDYLSFLKRSKHTFPYPVIRRDLFFESYQIVETRLFWGDSFTIFPGVVDGERLKILIEDAFNLEFEPVVVLNDESDLKRLKKSGFHVPFIATNFKLFMKMKKKIMKLGSEIIVIAGSIEEVELSRESGAKLFWVNWELVDRNPGFF